MSGESVEMSDESMASECSEITDIEEEDESQKKRWESFSVIARLQLL